MKLSTHKVQTILYLSLRLHKKNAMKLSIGLNFCLKPIVWMKRFTSRFKIIAEQYAEC